MNVKSMLLATLTTISMSVGTSWAAEMPSFPKPGPEHAWLQQMVGEWDSETESVMDPAKPAVKSKGTESIQSLGGYWIINNVQADMMGMPFKGMMTLGYDTTKKMYVGTWVDSMTGMLWNYEGTVDAAGKTLTLESEGLCPMRPGKVTQFKEVLELKDKDHKVFTSMVEGDNGKWMTMMTSHSHRKH